jgi:hypothetical protein
VIKFRMLAAAVAAAGALAAGAAVAVPATPASASTACGYWRWPVKTGSDADRWKVSTTVHYTSVGYLDGLNRPSADLSSSYYHNHRAKWPEFRTWQVKATLVAVKEESDGDYHLRLHEYGHNMIAEIPRPACVPSWSRWKDQIRAARSWVNSRFSVSSYSWDYIYRTIKVRGLGFFDEEHGVTGAAPNQIELHPVIMIRYP